MACIAAILFQGDILDGATSLDDRNCPLIVWHQNLNQAEIHKLDITSGRDLDVAWLDVAVEHRWVLGMHVLQGAAQLIGPGENLGLRKGLTPPQCVGQHLLKILTGDKVHDKVIPVVVGEIV
jgi:hypothetical protein